MQSVCQFLQLTVTKRPCQMLAISRSPGPLRSSLPTSSPHGSPSTASHVSSCKWASPAWALISSDTTYRESLASPSLPTSHSWALELIQALPSWVIQPCHRHTLSIVCNCGVNVVVSGAAKELLRTCLRYCLCLANFDRVVSGPLDSIAQDLGFATSSMAKGTAAFMAPSTVSFQCLSRRILWRWWLQGN